MWIYVRVYRIYQANNDVCHILKRRKLLGVLTSVGKAIKGHPKGLYYLFCTEAMERFSYYGMRAILVLYLVAEASKGGMGMARADALSVYATYTGLVYLTPLIGGMLADKYLGARKAIFIGGLIMMLGEMCLMLGWLNYGLALLILGNGFFKPNISTIVGHLYDDGDPRRDGAFTIFYMGINLGAFFSPLVCGTLADIFGFRYGFAAAAIGMAIGVIIFFFSQKSIGTAGFPPERDPRKAKAEREKAEFTKDAEVLDMEEMVAESATDLPSNAKESQDTVVPETACACEATKDGNDAESAIPSEPKEAPSDSEKSPVSPQTPSATDNATTPQVDPSTNLGGHHLLNGKDWLDILIYIVATIALAIGCVQALPYVSAVFDMISAPVKTTGGLVILVAAIIGLFWLAYSGGKKEGGKAQAISDVKAVAVILIISLFVIFFWLGFEQAGGTMTLFAEQATDRTLFGTEFPASYFQSVNPIFILILAPIFSVIWGKLDSSKHKLSVVYKMALGLIMLGLGFVLLYAGWAGVHDETGALVAKASPLILVGVYLIHTMGELCLSPIGLSLVTRISPARMVSLMMGVWFVSSGGANFVAGNLEAILKGYDINIFAFLIVSSFSAAVLLLLISPLLRRWMKE